MIGLFDSGVGGLSVLSEVRSLLPDADVVYVADRARAPYGTRSLDEVREISLAVALWLVRQGATTIVVACNTASAAGLEAIRKQHPKVAVVGMEPAVKPAVEISSAKTIGVFATAATFQGELFDSVVHRFAGGNRILTMACPEWVESVERGRISGRRTRTLVTRSVKPIVEKGADVLVLGCTHFSFLGDLISDVSGLPVIDPAAAVARRVDTVAADVGGAGDTRLLASGDLRQFERLVRKLTAIEGQFGVFSP